MAKGIRLVCEEIKSLPSIIPPSTAEIKQESFQLFEVFKPSGVPDITFIEPDNFHLLILALLQPGRGVVIEGPSGIGKTTALKKAVEKLQSLHQVPQLMMLTARRPEDVQSIESLPKWHKGIVAIDDFHRLNIDLKNELIDYLKYLADSEISDKKLVIVGIPQVARKLVEMSFDIALRIEVCKLGKVKDESILRMIEKGEKGLNILFDRKVDVVRAAAGSLNIAQLLCFQIAAQEGISSTQSQLKEVRSDLEAAIEQVMYQMSLKFGEIVRYFASLGGAKDYTCIELLQELANTEDGFLPLHPLKDTRPELTIGIKRFISENLIEELYNAIPASQNHLILDVTTPALIIDDPQLKFYISQISPNGLVRTSGKGTMISRKDVFISCSHKDSKWLDRLLIHLKPLERSSKINVWDDTTIRPGLRWRQEIEAAMASAKVVVILVSADYLASDFVAENELPPLLANARNEGTVVISLIVGSSLFSETPLANIQALNDPSKPLSSLTKSQQEEVFVRAAKTIERAVTAP